MHFLNGNEKILYLRKKLRITQNELSTENLSRGYIGLLENGKRNITKEVAIVLTEQFRKILIKKNYNLDIDNEYFLRTKEDEAEIYCEEKLKNDEITLEELERIKEITEEYKLDTYTCKIFALIGDIYYKQNEYEIAFEYYFSYLDLLVDIKENNILNPNIYNKMGICKYELLDYYEAIIYYKKAKDKAKNLKEEKIYYYAVYNLAICYMKLCKYEKAINEAQIFINKYWKNKDPNDISNVIYAKGIQVSCYEAKGYIDYAINIIEDIISNNKNLDKKVLGYLYNNVASLYVKNKKTDDAIFYYTEAQNIRYEYDKKFLSHTLIEKAKIYIDLNLYNEAIILLQLGIEYSYIYNDKDRIIQGYECIKEIYERLNIKDGQEIIILKLIELLDTNFIAKVKYYNELSELYLCNKNYNGANNCTKKVRQLFGHII